MGNCSGSWSIVSITAIFPGGPRLASTRMSPFWILLEIRIMEVVVTTGAIGVQSSSEIITTNKSTPNALPVAQLTVSEH